MWETLKQKQGIINEILGENKMTEEEMTIALIDEIIKMYVPDGNPEIWLNKIQKLRNDVS